MLFDGIVDEYIPIDKATLPRLSGKTEGFKADELKELISKEGLYYEDMDSDSSAEDSREDENEGYGNYRAGGKQGFNTNIDDFLVKFGSFVDNQKVEHRLSKGRSFSKGPLLSYDSQILARDGSETSDGNYTLKERQTAVLNRDMGSQFFSYQQDEKSSMIDGADKKATSFALISSQQENGLEPLNQNSLQKSAF